MDLLDNSGSDIAESFQICDDIALQWNLITLKSYYPENEGLFECMGNSGHLQVISEIEHSLKLIFFQNGYCTEQELLEIWICKT